MRLTRGTLCVALLCGCASEDPPEPIGSRFLLAAGGFESERVEMYRAGAQIELRHDGVRQAIGTLTSEGLAAWDDAVASIDPAIVPGLYQCAPVDGVDVCVDVEHESGPLHVCYCAIEPPPEVAEFDAFFNGLAEALAQCEPSSHIVIDQCEA